MRSGVSMTSYLEKHGSFRGQKEYGLIMWMLAHAMDSAAQGDFFATKEFLALLCASMDQAVLDGHWNIGYVIGLLEEPPGQMCCRSSTEQHQFGETIRSPGTAAVGGSEPILHQRGRPPGIQEDRAEEASSESRRRSTIQPFPSSQASFSQEAKGRRTCQSSKCMTGLVDRVWPGKGPRVQRNPVCEPIEASATVLNSAANLVKKFKNKNST